MVLNLLIVAACFALLSWLNGRYSVRGAGNVALYTFLGFTLALLFLAVLAGLNLATDPGLRRSLGFTGAWEAVFRGFLTMIPFTLLALLAELAFRWTAAPAFIQAGIMTSGAAVGVEIARRAGSKIRYTVVCMAGAFAFSIAWIAFSWIFTKAVM